MSDCGLSSTGFMSTVGGVRHASACSAVERPISPPSAVTAALFDMFCGLNGTHDFAAIREQPAQPRDQQRLADVRAAALDHQRGHSSCSDSQRQRERPEQRASFEIDLQCAAEVGALRAAAGSEQRSFVRHAFIGRRAAELDAERARHRCLGPARVRRCVARRIAPHHSQSAAACKDDQQSREPRGNEIGQIVRTSSCPAERAPARLAMTDETVGGVQRLVREQSRQSADREPERRRDDSVVEAFREAFDCGGRDARRRQLRRIAARRSSTPLRAQRADRRAREAAARRVRVCRDFAAPGPRSRPTRR